MREDLPLLFAFKLKLLLGSLFGPHAAMSRAYGCPDRCHSMSGTGDSESKKSVNEVVCSYVDLWCPVSIGCRT